MANTKRSDQDKPVPISEIIPAFEKMLDYLKSKQDLHTSCTFEFDHPEFYDVVNDLQEVVMTVPATGLSVTIRLKMEPEVI